MESEMTRLEALKELAVKVEAGEFTPDPGGPVMQHYRRFVAMAEIALPQDVWTMNVLAHDAYKGSLDAALALHNAMLPDAPAQLTDMRPYGGSGGWLVSISWNKDKDKHQAGNENLARAWLLAIIRALIEKEKTDG